MTNAEDIQRKRDSMDQTMPFAELYERSKDDRAIIVGSEVREVIGAYRRCLQRLDREPAAPALLAKESPEDAWRRGVLEGWGMATGTKLKQNWLPPYSAPKGESE